MGGGFWNSGSGEWISARAYRTVAALSIGLSYCAKAFGGKSIKTISPNCIAKREWLIPVFIICDFQGSFTQYVAPPSEKSQKQTLGMTLFKIFKDRCGFNTR
jgi:hypothetical protein